MNERIRGREPWHAKSCVFTELHREHHLRPGGLKGITVEQVGSGKTTYHYIDNMSLEAFENALLELWLHVREVRKQKPEANLLVKPVYEP